MKNRILKALPAKELRNMLPHLKEVVLTAGAALHESGGWPAQLYFPNEAMISHLAGTPEGETIEVCVVGNEGVVGLTSLLSDVTTFRAIVQIPGTAYSISREFLVKEFKRYETLHRLLVQYTNALLIQVAQTAVCNKFHSVEERFCRWLLMAHDRGDSRQLPLTQDSIARTLGSRRASISVVAANLRKRGVIQYHRGVITILDRKTLETSACECYQTIWTAHSKIEP